MARTRASAKQAGARFETTTAAALAQHIDDRIERRTLTGSKDRGDIAGVRLPNGKRVVIETKDYGGKYHVGPWLDEAEKERLNDGAEVGVVIAKRRGTQDPLEQVVLMSLADFVALIEGSRP